VYVRNMSLMRGIFTKSMGVRCLITPFILLP
jgi:hypothetical protein